MKFLKKYCYTIFILLVAVIAIIAAVLKLSDNSKGSSQASSLEEPDTETTIDLTEALDSNDDLDTESDTQTDASNAEDSKILSDTLEKNVPDTLLKQLNPEVTFTETAHQITVPYIYQLDNYPTGCEIVSATMLLQYWNYDYSVENMIDNYLPMSDLDYNEENDELSGESPYTSFIGTPYQEDSYGCYLPVIEYVLDNVTDSDKHAVYSTYGMSLDELCAYFVQNDIPVLVWETIGMAKSFPSSTWNIIGTEDTFTWLANEHCMVLVGYDENNYYFNDPYDEDGMVSYEKSLCQKRYEELHTQSLVIVPID